MIPAFPCAAIAGKGTDAATRGGRIRC